jgi:signal transduction histidine kinase
MASISLEKLEEYDTDKNAEIEFHKTGIEEFFRLNTTLAKLISRNNLIFNSQKEFIENAAHEMQTPLAVFKSKLELLQQQSLFSSESYEILQQLNATISRLAKLNKNLLLLSRVENQQFKELDAIDWTVILKKFYCRA